MVLRAVYKSGSRNPKIRNGFLPITTQMDDDTICVMGSLSTSKMIFNLLWTTFSHYWNSQLIQELLAGGVDHMASPEFEH